MIALDDAGKVEDYFKKANLEISVRHQWNTAHHDCFEWWKVILREASDRAQSGSVLSNPDEAIEHQFSAHALADQVAAPLADADAVHNLSLIHI